MSVIIHTPYETMTQTLIMDVTTGSGAAGFSGLIIPANMAIGDFIEISGYGNVTIIGETTRTYAGASRTVIYANYTMGPAEYMWYWDKQTGVLVEISMLSGSMTMTAKATETNMWQAQSSVLPIDPIVFLHFDNSDNCSRYRQCLLCDT